MSLHAIMTAHAEGFDENMYLDAATRTKVEETGGASILFVTKDNKVVTPKSDSILPSITRRSLMTVAEIISAWKLRSAKFTSRSKRFRRMRFVRHRRHLSGRKDLRSRTRNFIPAGMKVTSQSSTKPHRYSDGTYRSSGRLDPERSK